MCLQQVQHIREVHEHQGHQWFHGSQIFHPYQEVRGVQQVPKARDNP